MMNIYQDQLLDYYRNPRKRGTMGSPDFSSRMANSLCGDVVAIQGTLQGDQLVDCLFEGKGCIISQATASMLAEQAMGRPVAEIMAIDAQAMQSMIGMQLGPNRLQCALLPLEALKKGIQARCSIE